MGKQNSVFSASGDISEVNINIFGTDVEISAAQNFVAQYPDGVFSIEEKKGRVTVKRKKRGLSSLARVKLRLGLPESCLPAVKVNSDKCLLEVNGGIYGDLSIYGESSKIVTNNAAFNIIFVKGSELQCEYSGTTIKNAFICNAKSGDILAKESFFSRIDIDLKNGNIGLWETDFQMSEIKVHDGNIQAMLIGTSEDYKLTLTAKNGTSNLESGGNGAKSLKCTAVKGNVIVDFNKKNKEKINDVNDDVAEDTGGESGT